MPSDIDKYNFSRYHSHPTQEQKKQYAEILHHENIISFFVDDKNGTAIKSKVSCTKDAAWMCAGQILIS